MGKPDTSQFFDHCMKEALHRKANEVATQSILLDRINTEISYKKGENIMNNVPKLKRLKPLVIVAIVFILSAATCFAASQITSLVGSSEKAFEEFPTASQVEKAVDYTPDYVETFSNGFTFKSASVDNTKALDSEDSVVGESKGISFYYTNGEEKNGQFLSLDTGYDFPGTSDGTIANQEVFEVGTIEMTYASIIYKTVPEGYVPTEEENQKMEKGEMWISYGSDEIETSTLQFVKWLNGDISYNLMEKGYGLEKDEIIDMAKEVIGAAE